MDTPFLRSRLQQTFPAFRHRNFRLFWSGQCVSLIGTWMQNIGQSWLVLQLTGSPLKLGIVNALQWLPVMLLAFAAGPLVDRYPKRRILLCTQTALLLLALALSVLVWSGRVQYWHVLVLALLLGCVNTVDNPTRQAFVIELAGRDDLMNAISLNSTVFNLARILGPAVAGLLIGAVGIAPCFLINAVSFLAALWALANLDLADTAKARTALRLREFSRSIGDGVRYLRANRILLWPIVLIGLLSVFIMNYSVVIPIFARSNLGGDARTFGFLMTALGIGSTLGALSLAARSKDGPKLRVLLLGALGMSVFSLLAGLQHWFLLTCFLLALTGFCQITCTAQINAVLQIHSSDDMRGRVMSVYNLSFGGVTPIGSLYAGSLVNGAGAAADLVLSGALGIVSTAICAYALLGKPRKEQPGPPVNL
jgi:MFS family permease